jgi:hypothetical protein
MYHQNASWCPKGTRYNQDGLGYCWTWSGTGCFMSLRAMEGLPTTLLAPVSMGYLVNWANRGNYLESFIQGAREQGICPAIDGNINDLNRSASFWNQHADKRELFRLDEVWDTDGSSDDRMIQHAISGLSYGRSGFLAFNWWGHALELVGVRHDPKVYKGFVAVIRNSHNEDDFIELTGTKAVPDELYFFVSSKPSAS